MPLPTTGDGNNYDALIYIGDKMKLIRSSSSSSGSRVLPIS